MTLALLFGLAAQVPVSVPGDILPIQSRLAQGSLDWTTEALVKRRLGEPTKVEKAVAGVEWWTYDGKGVKLRIRRDGDAKRPVLPGGALCDLVVLFKGGSGGIGDLKVGDKIPSTSSLGVGTEPSSANPSDTSTFNFRDGRIQVWVDASGKIEKIALNAYDVDSSLSDSTYKPKQFTWSGLSIESARQLAGLEKAVYESLVHKLGGQGSDVGREVLFPGVRLVHPKPGEPAQLKVEFRSTRMTQTGQAVIQRDTKDPMSHQCRTQFELETIMTVSALSVHGKPAWTKEFKVIDQAADTVDTKIKQKVEYSTSSLESLAASNVLSSGAFSLHSLATTLADDLGYLRVLNADVDQGTFTIPSKGLTPRQQVDLVLSNGTSLRFDPESLIQIAGSGRVEKAYVESINGSVAQCRIARQGFIVNASSQNAITRMLNPRSGIIYARPTTGVWR